MSTRMSDDYVGTGTAGAATSAQLLAREKPVWGERMMTALPSRVDKGWFFWARTSGWKNEYFVKLGLFSMQTALVKCHSHG